MMKLRVHSRLCGVIAGVLVSLAGTDGRAQQGDDWIVRRILPTGELKSEPYSLCNESSCDEAAGGSSCLSGLCKCDRLTGDWLGQRTSLAESGITLDADVTQFYMGVTRGGLEREFRYSGHGDYVVNIDSAKLGGPQGLFVKIRAEHRFGESMVGATGAVLPTNIAADLPVADSENLYLTDVLFTQMFSETFGVFFGKLNTLDGDMNAFAHGRGKTQFSNAAFVVTPVGFRTVVYSTLGAGFTILWEGEQIFTFTVLNASDTTRTTGLGDLFADGVVLVPELRLPTDFFGLPGHQLLGASWSSRDFAALDQDPIVVLPDVPIANRTGSWSLYWNFDQYLFADSSGRGWGVFGRAGIADKKTNPIEHFLSFGVGGNSILPGREADTFGIGWYRSGTSGEVASFVATLLGGLGDSQGVELFYNVEVTPAFHLTADLQYLKPARQAVSDPLLVGLRAMLSF